MPRPEPTLEEVANRDDPSDEDYEDGQRRSRKTTQSKAIKAPSRSRKRPAADQESDDSPAALNDAELSASESDPSPEDDSFLERNARGTVKRGATKRRKYQDPSSDEEEEEEEEQAGSEDELGQAQPRDDEQPRRHLILKLPNTQADRQASSPPAQTTRSRARSDSIKDSDLTHVTQFGNRRSTRTTHDNAEDMLALTGSGQHIETVRQGTRSPEVEHHYRTRRTASAAHAAAKSTTIVEERQEEVTETKPKKDPLDRASQVEVMESDPQAEPEEEEEVPAVVASDAVNADAQADVEMGDGGFVPESQHDEQDEDDEAPRSGTRTRSSRKELVVSDVVQRQEDPAPPRRSSRKTASKSGRKKQDEGSDFEPNEEEEANDDDVSDSGASQQSPRKDTQNSDGADERSAGRRSGLRKHHSQPRADSEAGDLHEEVTELKTSRSRRRANQQIAYESKPRRNRKSVDYRLIRPEMALPLEEAENEPAASPSRRARNGGGGSYQRGLFSTYGPFGGAGGPPPLLGGGPAGMGVTGGVDSDSSDDESGQRPRVGGAAGMTPTSALTSGLNLGGVPPQQQQAHGGADAAAQGTAGTPANLGKVKDKQALADSDPLGVDPNVNFDSVGGLQGHIDQLKEMVSLPLLYPEVFQRFHIVPPRGVLFHGPPGTGKTLLARALATSVSSEGRKVTFYMRKGADALSKWVGEAERQLRLLFDEARKNQPSIIFFDEIDGLAPVRSSKQEQIHSSIVSTLLALMDGMDGRGQVIVIGATNRPDSVDPALRRPGRFDREFYFPLPNTEARRAILNINTKGWDPPLPSETKDELSELTKGYGGADLRALCTEAALNAVQRKYPQIYRSNEKLLIDPKKIDVNAKDFMISIKKLVPSSERAASSGASPLPETVEPLLRGTLRAIEGVIGQIIPLKKKTTALEEAQFEEPQDQNGFKRERMQSAFETSRVFRPRLLIRGSHGMGQQYLAAALLNHFEGLHLQPFDLPTLLSDSTRSPEATVVQLFTEVKRHKPSVIYIPDVNTWYDTVGHTVVSTFLGLLRSLPPTDPVLLLGVSEGESNDDDPEMVKALFGYSKKNTFALQAPDNNMRREFFQPLVDYIKTAPSDFPDPTNRKKRKLETLPPAPAPETASSRQRGSSSRDELKSQKKKDRQTLNLLKIRIQPIMNEIKKYKRFRTGVIDDSQIRYLFDEEDPNVVTTDLPMEQRTEFRPFEKDSDKYGVPGLRDVVSDKFFYNIEIVTIEKRLSNGYYKRPKDFLADIKRVAKDARKFGDQDRLIKANELLSNVEVDVGLIEQADAALVSECENVYARELERERLVLEKAQRNAAREDGTMGPPPTTNVAHGTAEQSNQSTEPVVLGEQVAHAEPHVPSGQPVTPTRAAHQGSLTNGNAHHFEPNPEQPPLSGSGGSYSHDKSGTDHDGDVQMSNSENTSGAANDNTQNSSFGPSAQPRPPHSHTAPSQQMRQESGLSNYSQKRPMTPMAPGSQPNDYANDASTTQTTSDKKHSGPTDQSNSLSGRNEGPDLNLYPDRISGDEHLPDTQQGSSSGSQQPPLTGILEYAHSQPGSGAVNGSQQHQKPSQPRSQQEEQPPRPPVPPFNTFPQQDTPQRGQHIHELLNNDNDNDDDDDDDAAPARNPDLVVDEQYTDKLHTVLTSRTSGYSVEQLEQINTNLMDCIWKTRDDWNRANVVGAVQGTFNDVLADMQSLQEFGPLSQKTKTDFARSRV